ncbi:MAG: bifunctional helix-turn-helix domain-containing protein/methylated-DNA--[protein]-cysteine S-methyltransferase [Xanthobacteraceae bacterium]|nr:bifunctional helix-turn-helix domain-containing protein/methylated-DNA--[protein]-cysteine S-methyltransferase [Xanthobacteraceae bacterium]QYK45036.1 MAG: bifunctional helix-turn-helix domain-containing protein/methylated-DNA--[protein]-cysteine S-methyltransferase [Xanthobacteraceae bacterium]
MLAGAMKISDTANRQDYETVRRAIEYLTRKFREQPEVEAVAAAMKTDPRTLNELFRRWCGLTPKAFLQAVTLDNAKQLLAQSPNILETSYELGLSGPGRLHDLFVVHEAMSPGEWKTGGEGLEIRYGFHPSPFGTALVMVTKRGLCGLAFADPGKENAALKDMRARWKNADYAEDSAATADIAARIFQSERWKPDTPLRVVLIGTDFEVRVWETLLKVPLGRAATYSDVAKKIGKDNAARAVGAAVGKNPISFVVPCHRIVGVSGALTGYHWGLTRKRAMLGWEQARLIT